MTPEAEQDEVFPAELISLRTSPRPAFRLAAAGHAAQKLLPEHRTFTPGLESNDPGWPVSGETRWHGSGR